MYIKEVILNEQMTHWIFQFLFTNKICFYSQTDEYNQYGNIMYDRRVIRGNTYALNTLPAVS